MKFEGSLAPVPIPADLALRLSAYVAEFPRATGHIVTDGRGNPAAPSTIDRAIRAARPKIDGMPERFRFHDLRH